jgi:hypothetical protein
VPGWDASVSEVCWAPDGSGLFLAAQERGRNCVFFVPLLRGGGGVVPAAQVGAPAGPGGGITHPPRKVLAEHCAHGLSVLRPQVCPGRGVSCAGLCAAGDDGCWGEIMGSIIIRTH